MAQAMGKTTKVMQSSNKAMNMQKVQQTMMQFERESSAMDMKEEMSTAFTGARFIEFIFRFSE